ncbi:MAG: formyltetrahydrofolate deformylase [Pseudomonadaceae bacterium]|nr:formyltetrahydrofolate deformylase [Pseudomonadaceae bacterium]
MDSAPEYVLTFSCPDQRGIVHAVTRWLVANDGNILDSDQFGDAHSATFFMRVHFAAPQNPEALTSSFDALREEYSMVSEIWPLARRPKALIMVSKMDHCLIDLLYRVRNGEIDIDIPLVVSNHRDAYPLAASSDVDFLHLPVDPGNKAEQEAKLQREIEERGVDFIVLARYMQVLSPQFCRQHHGRIINIHHSFLPSFKGAKPYHQAFERGVKLIGATAHYVTADLDEGPIIEQGIERVDHRTTPGDLVAVGRDIERVVLAKAVRYQAEHRVLLNGQRTVVFQ